MTGFLLIFLAAAAVIAALVGIRRARRVRDSAAVKTHSRPIYHGLNAAIWTGVPALIFLILWALFKGPIIDMLVLASHPGAEALSESEADLLLSEIRQVAAGTIFKEPTPEVRDAAVHLQFLESLAVWALVAVAAALAAIGAYVGFRVVKTRFRARHSVERSITWFMLFSSLVAILTTAGIVGSLLYEALAFFAKVPIQEFLFGLRWEPQIAIRADQVAGQGAFGMLPVLFGTFVISMLAMAVAIPVGVFSAIYLTEYAGARFRAVVKPLLEILAGIPTIVYGFFAVLTVAPLIRDLGQSIGINASPNSALAAGGVMGVMLIPFISSLSDDAFAAVPRAIREGSFALGATKGETIRKVLLPAALPGIVGGILLALSRAIGETMIVVMAAGLIAKITANPFESVTTVTVQIVTLLIGDSEFDNPKTLAAFALGLVLFIITLGLNLIALRTVRKYREQY
ncbi:phosphate ABC transporter permease subunit PstC [Pseudohoeflea coraliihabitans]|uniref:Phosphate transport system permease protein n=1 Tax=Pseudohoeflea coraliihabitans TaxID=2860393 RepID=A0ABS6WQ35_9HYPH|nr:phosphate ABC transporter permease subunit PstC [Pseudohoeflea sp. DP4N28-3]MBW3097497.1 phosphate ABC transporter permease subunit PstC [Pseudohoeflea sp. DP4N28-3]